MVILLQFGNVVNDSNCSLLVECFDSFTQQEILNGDDRPVRYISQSFLSRLTARCLSLAINYEGSDKLKDIYCFFKY